MPTVWKPKLCLDPNTHQPAKAPHIKCIVRRWSFWMISPRNQNHSPCHLGNHKRSGLRWSEKYRSSRPCSCFGQLKLDTEKQRRRYNGLVCFFQSTSSNQPRCRSPQEQCPGAPNVIPRTHARWECEYCSGRASDWVVTTLLGQSTRGTHWQCRQRKMGWERPQRGKGKAPKRFTKYNCLQPRPNVTATSYRRPVWGKGLLARSHGATSSRLDSLCTQASRGRFGIGLLWPRLYQKAANPLPKPYCLLWTKVSWMVNGK